MERNPRSKGRVIDTLVVSRAGEQATIEVRFKADYNDPANMFYVRCEKFGLDDSGANVTTLVDKMRADILSRLGGTWTRKILVELALDPDDRIGTGFRAASTRGQSIGFGYIVLDWLEKGGQCLGWREHAVEDTERKSRMSLSRKRDRGREPSISTNEIELGTVRSSYSDSTDMHYRVLFDYTPELEAQCEAFKARLTDFGDALATFMTVEKFRKMLDRSGPLALAHKPQVKKGKP